MLPRPITVLALALLAGGGVARAQDAPAAPPAAVTPVAPPAAVVPAAPPAELAAPPAVVAAPAAPAPQVPRARLARPADAPSEASVADAYGAFLGGQFALSANRPAEAAPLFLQALHDDPGNALLVQQSFLACLLAGRPEAAGLAARLPNSAVALLLLGDQAAEAGDWAGAQQRFAGLPQQPLTEILRPLAVAWAQQGAGDTDAALATLQARMGGPQAAGIYPLHAGLIAELAGRTGDAERLLRTAQSQFPGLNLRLAQVLASFEARHGRAAEAEATLRALVQQQPQLAIAQQGLLAAMATPVVRTPRDGLAEVYFAMAATLRQQNADGFAQVLLQLTLELRPDLTAARLLLADVLEAQGNAPAAVALVSGVAPGDPLAPLARLREAQLDERAGRHDDAARLLVALAQAHPDSAVPLALLAGVQSNQKRYAEAAASLDRAIARVPRPGPGDWELFYRRGVALDLAHQWPRAQADLEHALVLSPDQPAVLNYLAYSWADQGRNLPRARQMLEKAVAAQPNNAAIVDSLGWTLLRAGDVPGAVRWLERACELDPIDATLNGHLGDAYWAAGRRVEAMDQWRRALSLNPEPQEKTRIEGRMHAGDAAPRMPPGRTRAALPTAAASRSASAGDAAAAAPHPQP